MSAFQVFALIAILSAIAVAAGAWIVAALTDLNLDGDSE